MIQFSKFMLCLVLVSLVSNAAVAQDALVGKWKIVAETPEGESTSVWTFTRSDGKITGKSVSEDSGQESTFDDVEFEGDKLVFSIDIEMQGAELVLDLESKITGDTLKGTWIAMDTDGSKMANGDLSGTKMAKEAETEVLFDGKSMDNFRGYKQEAIGKGWKVEDGAIYFDGTKGSGDIMTKKEYGSFELTFEWKISEGGNSGVMYRVKQGDRAPYLTGIEYQILDNDKHKDGKNRLTCAGSIYAMYPPGDKQPKAVGQWNTSKIVVDGDKIEHWLNGDKVAESEVGSDDWNKKLAASKFATWEKFAKNKRGHIAFQDHRDKVWYRNIKIKAMD